MEGGEIWARKREEVTTHLHAYYYTLTCLLLIFAYGGRGDLGQKERGRGREGEWEGGRDREIEERKRVCMLARASARGCTMV